MREPRNLVHNQGRQSRKRKNQRKEIDKNRTYRISTISYIYEGNDDLVSFAKANLLYSSDRPMKFDIADYVKENPKLSLDHTKRITNK